MKTIKIELELEEFETNKHNDFISSIINEVEEKRSKIQLILRNNEKVVKAFNEFSFKIISEFNQALKPLNLEIKEIPNNFRTKTSNIYKLGDIGQSAGIKIIIKTPFKYNSKLKVDEYELNPTIFIHTTTPSHITKMPYEFKSVEEVLKNERETILRLYEGNGKIEYFN